MWLVSHKTADQEKKIQPMILRCSVSWKINNFEVLCGETLEFHPKQLTLLLGKSGVGKTSFIETITGFRTFGELHGELNKFLCLRYSSYTSLDLRLPNIG